ncbi:hypothetical protein [Mycolicibacter kumamotonensis]|uniref:Nitroreductase family deazaflavin-dependent oxidoreductase n=1 Tax=Mycolicibacter kumamotonensis TaxID=354243 RepID=A0A1X0DRS7_9MYCO|nr:hypothetical protein [Mycolicibacter kumamotonensis]NDJ89585.1 hypothetical protein [Mycolicibacter kumamotonensis]ORA75038.1 hypothetical protein BST28_22305 [Mycolicibacter kumamotonensis]
MGFGGPARMFIRAFNAVTTSLVTAPLLGSRLGRRLTMISYTGRRSGQTFSLPVGYWRSGDQITIGVALPDAKTWWRNFSGDGAPLKIRLDGADRSGHAVAERDEQGRVKVVVRLDPR